MGKKIFIIEDDANTLYTLQAKLSVGGFKVKVNNGTSNIVQVMNEVKEFKPDYVILDLILPQVDGFQMAKELRGDEDTNNIPVFVFTQLSDSDSRNMSANFGVKYYFVKSESGVDEFISRFLKIIENNQL